MAGVVHGGFSQIDNKTYPAHLHINIEQTWRGHGLDRKLIQAYLDQLSSLGVPGVHLETNSQNQIACNLYEKTGFKLLWANPDYFWTKWFGYNVENRCYGRIIP